MKHFLLAIAAIFFGLTTGFSQDLEKKWQFDAIQDENGLSLFEISDTDAIHLKAGEFKYSLSSKNLEASGDYIHQNNLLVFYYTQPKDTIRRYKIKTLTDSTLVFTENGTYYNFKSDTNIINEVAPRPHNSGHLTIEGHATSQFEQHIRAVCGLPLGSTQQVIPAAMVNLLGDQWADGLPNWAAAMELPGVKLHLYGKHSPAPARKMGHITAVADSSAAASKLVTAARVALGSK